MKLKLLLAGMIATVALNAQTGTEVFESKCVACHMMKPMMDKQKMMQMSKEERMSMKAKMMETMKAPPMSKVSSKIKFELKDDKTAFVTFVKDYIVNPSAQKSHCMPMALKKFGVMPAIGKGMTDEEINTVANWLYDNFTEKWNPNDMGMMCKAKNAKGMKCGEGKCGGMNKTAKPMNSKCGASHKKESAGKCAGDKPAKKETPKAMKCAAGKCGSK
jgi:mono/diheme cytochrome c family protein